MMGTQTTYLLYVFQFILFKQDRIRLKCLQVARRVFACLKFIEEKWPRFDETQLLRSVTREKVYTFSLRGRRVICLPNIYKRCLTPIEYENNNYAI